MPEIARINLLATHNGDLQKGHLEDIAVVALLTSNHFPPYLTPGFEGTGTVG